MSAERTLSPVQLDWMHANLASLHRQRVEILKAASEPWRVLVNPDQVPEGVIGGTILGLQIDAADVDEPTVAVREWHSSFGRAWF